jgi:hypothetical protein
VVDIVGLGEVDFEDPVVDRPRTKPRGDGHDNNTSDTFGLAEFAGDSEDNEKDLYAGEDPYMLIAYSEGDFISN